MKTLRKALLIAILGPTSTGVRSALQEPERLPQPSPTELSRSRSKVRSALEADFEQERLTVSQKLQLVRTLLETAGGTEPGADRYALYVEAEKAASEAGSVRLLDESLAALAREFEVERWERLVGASGKVETSIPWQEAENAECLLGLAELALRSNELDAAAKLGALAVGPAKASQYKPLSTLCDLEKRRLEQTVKSLRRAQEKLGESPEDRAANLVLGSFLLSCERDEEAGLEALQRCGVEALSAAAELELQGPESSEAFQSLAEAWEKAALDQPAPEFRAALMARAAANLARATEGLTGLQQKVLAKRLDELRAKAQELRRDPHGQALDDQRAFWRPKARVKGVRGLDSRGATLAGVIVTSDEQWLEVELTETWTVNQGKLKGQTVTPKYLWRFERIADDPRTGRVTFAVRAAKLMGPGDPNHRRNYEGTVTIRGKIMAGDYRFDWTKEAEIVKAPLDDWFLELE